MAHLPPDDTIEIEVYESMMTGGRFIVKATYSGDTRKYKICGSGYAQKGCLYFLGIGDSLETSLKKATCEAIRELKQLWLDSQARVEKTTELTTICINHAKECSKEK